MRLREAGPVTQVGGDGGSVVTGGGAAWRSRAGWAENAGPAPGVRDGAAGRVGAMPPGPRASRVPRPGRRAPRPRRYGEPRGHGVAPAPEEEVGARPSLRALARLLPHQHLQAGQWPVAVPRLLRAPQAALPAARLPPRAGAGAASAAAVPLCPGRWAFLSRDRGRAEGPARSQVPWARRRC